MLRNMFRKTYTKIDTKYRPVSHEGEEPSIPEGLWRKCNKCGQPIYVEDVKNNYYVCPKCGGYFRVHAYRRIEMLTDVGTFEEWNKEMPFSNPLDFPNYEKKVEAAREKTNLNEAIVIGKAKIDGNPAVVGVCDARFIMSSMGHVVGEKITEAVERATKEKLPVILFACSGGARMQEGIVSLMQMAKTSAALKRHSDSGLLYISVLTNPTTGGVTASFAMLGDIILAEPGALIGFAGPRVIEQTIRQKLPKGFQSSEFLLEHGFIDQIAERKNMKETLARLLKMHCKNDCAESLEGQENAEKISEKKSDSADGMSVNNKLNVDFTTKITAKKSAWEHVSLARSKERPTGKDYLPWLFDYFIELHGDRLFGDDPSLIGGIAYLAGKPVTVIAQEKGNGTKENIAHNFGMVSPEGYRKSLRLMKQAEKFHRPVICLVDTPGAFCGLEAEERGQGEAIARNLYELSSLKVPVLSIVIGEGGSGGALALAAGDQVWMMENSIYSILSPEGFASILWKDSTRAKEAAEVMKLTAVDLKDLGIIEQVIPENQPLTRENMADTMEELKNRIEEFLETYQLLDPEKLLNKRYKRFRNL